MVLAGGPPRRQRALLAEAFLPGPTTGPTGHNSQQ